MENQYFTADSKISIFISYAHLIPFLFSLFLFRFANISFSYFNVSHSLSYQIKFSSYSDGKVEYRGNIDGLINGLAF